VFRTAPTDPAGATSVYLTTLYGLASFDRTYGQQHVFANVNFGRVLYSGGLSSYDYDSQTVDAGYRLGSWQRFNLGIEWVRSAARSTSGTPYSRCPMSSPATRSPSMSTSLSSGTGIWLRTGPGLSSATRIRCRISRTSIGFGGQVGVRYVPIYGNRIDLSSADPRQISQWCDHRISDAGYRDRLADLRFPGAFPAAAGWTATPAIYSGATTR